MGCYWNQRCFNWIFDRMILKRTTLTLMQHVYK